MKAVSEMKLKMMMMKLMKFFLMAALGLTALFSGSSGVISLYGAMPVEAAEIELLTNPGFEIQEPGSYAPGWQRFQGTLGTHLKFETHPHPVYEGDWSFAIYDNSSSNGYGLRSSFFPASPGQKYTASVMAMTEQNGQAYLYLDYTDVDGKRIKDRSVYTECPDWEKLTVTMEAPEGTAFVSIILYTKVAPTGIARFDNASLTLISDDAGMGAEWVPVWEQASEASKPEPVKNIILFIGDGMGFAHLKAARLVKGAPLNMDFMPVQSQAQNASLNSAVTDSAAAATALATGYRTNNGMIAMLPDGRRPVSSLRLAKEKGKKTGVVVTDSIYGATPGSFLANVDDRNKYAAILEQALFETQPDILFGGGMTVFNQIKGADRLKDTDYTLVTDRDQLLSWHAEQVPSMEDGRLLGLFAASSMSYEIDRNSRLEPHIAEMTQVAIDVLKEGDEGFFLMIEGSRIDNASHNNDLRRMVHDLLAFDEAVAVALSFAAGRDDALIVITADHETGGLIPGDNPVAQVISRGSDAVAQDIINAIKQDPEADILSLFSAYAGITELKPAVFQGDLSGFIKYLLQGYSFYYTSGSHSDAPVPVFAQGPGANKLAEAEHIVDIGRLLIEILTVDDVEVIVEVSG